MKSEWWPWFLISSSGLGCFIALLNGKFLLATGLALLILAYYKLVIPVRRQVLRRRFEECPDSLRPHTALTTSGVRHVQPSSPKQQSFVLDIPYEDIVSIKIHAMSEYNVCKVCLSLASNDDGFEYITSGYYQFPTVAGQTQLSLIGLKEPVRFKKTILAMKDKFSLSTPTSKGAQLLSRLEACLESVNSPNISDLEVNQVLIKLVDEMREFNQVYSSVRGVTIV